MLDNVTEHLKENRESGLLVALTETGQFHITVLRLNWPELIEHRKQRCLVSLWAEQIDILKIENAKLRASIMFQEVIFTKLLSQIAYQADEDQNE